MKECIIFLIFAMNQDVISSNTRVMTKKCTEIPIKRRENRRKCLYNFNVPDYKIFPHGQNVDNVVLYHYKT